MSVMDALMMNRVDSDTFRLFYNYSFEAKRISNQSVQYIVYYDYIVFL